MKVFAKDENAVSPIVATLVLIVVAVVGAVSVGTIMGTFSDDVTQQTNTGDISSASATEILIAGSTTVQPVSELLAEAYMKENPGVKITVQGGGSGAGISAAGMGIADIGAASTDMDDTQKDKYPEVKEVQIGASAVVIIANENVTADTITTAELEAIYTNTAAPTYVGGITSSVQRAEESGTEETFSQYVFDDKHYELNSTYSANGNAGVLKAVQDTDMSIGFVDAGYALDADGIKLLTIDGEEATSSNIKAALKGDTSAYPEGLTRPLNYIISDNPSSIVSDFITFAQSPGAIEYFDEVGMYSIMSL
jgi:phosphate transport system substrate-binding protein